MSNYPPNPPYPPQPGALGPGPDGYPQQPEQFGQTDPLAQPHPGDAGGEAAQPPQPASPAQNYEQPSQPVSPAQNYELPAQPFEQTAPPVQAYEQPGTPAQPDTYPATNYPQTEGYPTSGDYPTAGPVPDQEPVAQEAPFPQQTADTWPQQGADPWTQPGAFPDAGSSANQAGTEQGGAYGQQTFAAQQSYEQWPNQGGFGAQPGPDQQFVAPAGQHNANPNENLPFILSIAGMVLGIVGVACIFFLPSSLMFLGIPLGLAALAAGIVALIKKRGGMAIAAIALGGVALLLSLALVIFGALSTNDATPNYGYSTTHSPSTEEYLKDYVNVEIGSFSAEKSSYTTRTKVPVTIKNISSDVASFDITIVATASDGSQLETDYLYAMDLEPDQSKQDEAFSYVQEEVVEKMKTATFKVTSIRMM